MNNQPKQRREWQPWHFILSSVFAGFWVPGMMLSINYQRVQDWPTARKVGRMVIWGQLLLWLGVVGLNRFVFNAGPMSHKPWTLFLLLTNGLLGYVLYLAQDNLYYQYATQFYKSSKKEPFIRWQLCFMGLLGTVITALVIGQLEYRFF
jgi:putative copper export protein